MFWKMEIPFPWFEMLFEKKQRFCCQPPLFYDIQCTIFHVKVLHIITAYPHRNRRSADKFLAKGLQWRINLCPYGPEFDIWWGLINFVQPLKARYPYHKETMRIPDKSGCLFFMISHVVFKESILHLLQIFKLSK